MGTDNFARGLYNHPSVPFYAGGAGLSTEYGTLLPPGSRVAAYVRSTRRATDESTISKRLYTTLAAGLAQVEAGYGDTVFVLPGHSESITDGTFLTNLKAGTNVIGIGQGAYTPTFRWTATAGQMAVAVAACTFKNLRLRMEGANGVTKAMLITAADFTLDNCDIEVASGAALKAAIAIEVGAGADRCTISNCRIRGTATHNVTDGIKVVAAVSDLAIIGNMIQASATAANGLIHITAAALNCYIGNNIVYNTHTASTACIAVDNIAANGVLAFNMCATINNGVATAQGITLGAASLFRAFENYSSDEPNRSGVLNLAAPAT